MKGDFIFSVLQNYYQAIFSQPTRPKYWSSKLHYLNFPPTVIVLVSIQHLSGVPKTRNRSL